MDGTAPSGQQKVRIKNKLPAPTQITAEQLLREASERLGGEQGPKRLYLDAGNLDDYRQRERAKFEDALRRARSNVALYLRYAKWEETQGDMARARSVYERAIAQDHRQHALWLRYGEAEMRAGNVALARNVWDRAVTVLPRHDQFWYKRAAMEQAMSEWHMARAVFDRWMRWEPDLNAWKAFAKFELGRKEYTNVRLVYERMLLQFYSDPKVWQDYARFEEKEALDCASVDANSSGSDGTSKERSLKDLRTMRARSVFERSLHCLRPTDGELSCCSHIIEFAKFEARAGEPERARCIYRAALQLFPDSDTLRHSYLSFEKQHGDTVQIGEIVLEKRRKQYERRVAEHPYDYDAWFDLVRLEEALFLADPSYSLERVREAYEQAISKIPVVQEKRYWRRYIFLFLFYALFEEERAGSPQRAIEVLKAAIKVIPHAKFTFAKVWTAISDVYIRCGDLKAARLTLGQAIGRCPKPRLFKYYIELELELREFDRCRVLYEKYLEFAPASPMVWIRFAELERALGEEERVRALYGLAINAEELDVPELVWKAYIDFEVESERYDNARALYERLLERTQHVKVFIGYANMELQSHLAGDGDAKGLERLRSIMKTAYSALSSDEDRLVVVETWRDVELSLGNEEFVADTLQPYYLPRCVGEGEIVWPEPQLDNAQRLLGLAKRWKQSAVE